MKKLLLLLLCFISMQCLAQGLKSGLMVYLPFDGDLKDYSGNNNHGIDHGGITFVADQSGKPNTAAYFDGENDWVEILDRSDLILSKEATISFKFKTESAARQDIIVKAYYVDASGIQFQVEFNSADYHPTNKLFFGTDHNFSCSPVGMASHYVYADSLITEKRWYCVALTFDSGVKRMYIDGRLAATSTVTGLPNNYSIDNCQSDIRIGMWWQGDPAYFKGAIDDVRIYNRVLNGQELSTLCYKQILNHGPDLETNPATPVLDTVRQKTQSINEVRPGDIPFKIYPNPASDNLEIIVDENIRNGRVRIYNQLGQLVLSDKISGERSSLDISDFPFGNYILELSSENGNGRKHFVKQ